MPLEEVRTDSDERSVSQRWSSVEFQDGNSISGLCTHPDLPHRKPYIEHADETDNDEIRERGVEDGQRICLHGGIGSDMQEEDTEREPPDEPMGILPDIMEPVPDGSNGGDNHQKQTERKKGNAAKQYPFLPSPSKRHTAVHLRHIHQVPNKGCRTGSNVKAAYGVDHAMRMELEDWCIVERYVKHQ